MIPARRLLIALGGVGTAAIVIAALTYTSPETKPVLEPIDVTLAVYRGEISAPVYVAADHGFFDEHNLNVTLTEFAAGALAADALNRGAADIATAAEFVFVANLPDHPDMRLFGKISSFRLSHLIARADKGIAEARDLRGRRIGVVGKANSEYYLGVFLLHHGLTLGEVEVVYLPPNRIVEAFEAGAIDAAQTWDPYISELRNRMGAKAVVLAARPGFEPVGSFLLMTSADWLADNAEAADRMIAALTQATAYIRENPEPTKALIARKFDLAASYVDYIFPKIGFGMELSQDLLVVMEDQTRWAIANEVVQNDKVPNYLEYIYFSSMESAAPNQVRIIR